MRKKIATLDSMRFMWIMTIVMSHLNFMCEGLGGDFYRKHLMNGRTGVYYFFVLSGFGLTYSIIRRNSVGNCLEKKRYVLSDLYNYARNKIKKIYIPYILSIVLCIPITLYQAIELHGIQNGLLRTMGKAVFVPFLIQSGTGINGFSHAFNGVCWFLSTLFILYFTYPILDRLNVRIWKNKRIIVASIIGIVTLNTIWHIVLKKIESNSVFDALSYESPYFRIICFVLGILLCDLRYSIPQIRNATLNEVLVLGFSILWWLSRNTIIFSNVVLIDSEIKEVLDMLFPALCIFVFSYEGGLLSNILKKNTYILLGECSMYVFLFHSVFVGNTVPIIEKLIHSVEVKKSICFLVISLGTIFAIVIMYHIRNICKVEERDILYMDRGL